MVNRFIAEQFGGKTRFIDPQVNEPNAEYFLDLGIIPSKTKILKIDNRKFTSLIEDCVE